MAQYATAAAGWTPVAHADGASSLANSSYHGLRTASTSTMKVTWLYIGGEATSSTVNRMAVRRSSTNANTPTNVAPGLLNPLSQAAVSQSYFTATTGATIASTAHLMNLAFNAFGGAISIYPPTGGEMLATASTAPNGELILDSISGTGLVSTEVYFEEI